MSRMDTRQTVAIDDLSPLRKLSAVRRRGVVHEIRSAGYSIDALLRSAEEEGATLSDWAALNAASRGLHAALVALGAERQDMEVRADGPPGGR